MRIKKIRGVKIRRRREGEVAQPMSAIRNHCLECNAYQQGETASCPAAECWLWPYRFGRTPKGEDLIEWRETELLEVLASE